jgi:imidazolonepropionase-like amidohydrolase
MTLRTALLFTALLTSVSCATAPNATTDDTDTIAFIGATVVSLNERDADRNNTAIIVRDGTITSIIETDSVPSDAIRIDVSGLYALPGIIDTHIHVATPPNREQAEVELRDMLHAGITTARSMADDARSAAELSRRAYVNDIESPDIVYAAVFAGPTFMNDRRVQAVTAGLSAGDVPWMRRIDENTDIPDVVTQARGSGASGIKIYADLTGEQVAAIAAEAKTQNIPSWAHTAVYPAGPDAVAAAGVSTMSHACSLAHTLQPTMPTSYRTRDPMPDRDETRPLVQPLIDTFAAMREHGTILDATSVFYDWLEDPSTKPELCSGALSADMTRLAFEHGVAISTGTDFKTKTGPAAIHLEMRYLKDVVGISIDDVWIAATQTGATVVGADNTLGQIEPGFHANILFYQDDPTESLDALDTLEIVVKRGHITTLEQG